MPQAACDINENLSVEFSGSVFESHEISAASLAQSLLALDSLARYSAQAVYGRNAQINVKVKGSPRPGSFIVDLLIQHAPELGAGGGLVTILMGIVAAAKWGYGKFIKKVGDGPDNKILVQNEIGQTAYYNSVVINLYNQSRIGTELSRFTQALDHAGVDSIKLSDSAGEIENITREDRQYLRREEGTVITDNEATMLLEIIGAKFNGSPHGWTFLECGDEAREFSAHIEDSVFLQAVKDNEYVLKNGTTILAVVRTVQKKLKRTVTERSIIEVLEVNSSLDN